jgi:hypothetical protein
MNTLTDKIETLKAKLSKRIIKIKLLLENIRAKNK